MNTIKKLIPTILICITLALTASGLTACSPTSQNTKKVSKSDFYFDTVITITLYDTTDAAPIDECFALAAKYEQLFSNTIATSEVSQINSKAGTGEYVTVSDETLELLKLGIHYCELSNGSFDITCGTLSDLWNISAIANASESATHEENASVVPSKDEIQKALSTVNYHNIEVDDHKVRLTNAGTKLDLGGIAKGYIADQMRAYLNSSGITAGVINLGGNLMTIGSKADQSNYMLGIHKPFDAEGAVLGSLEIPDGSVVSSGIYERYYRVDGKIYHHIIDLSTGYPCKNNLYQVTIISPTSVAGDALSTTCLLAGLEDGMALIERIPDTEAIFVTDQYEIYTTSGIGDKIVFR